MSLKDWRSNWKQPVKTVNIEEIVMNRQLELKRVIKRLDKRKNEIQVAVAELQEEEDQLEIEVETLKAELDELEGL